MTNTTHDIVTYSCHARGRQRAERSQKISADAGRRLEHEDTAGTQQIDRQL